MSNRRRTLNIQSIAYNASTNTPSLANMVDGAVYKVSVEGIQTIGGTSKFCAVNDLIVNVGGVTSFLHVSNVNFNASTGVTAGGTTVTQSQLTETGRKIYITASGKITGGTVVNGTTGGDSYLIAGDTLETINNVLTITSQINSGSIINVGIGGLFSNMSVANDYLNLRNYVDVTLNLLSATTETASIDVTNDCGGALTIRGNGFTIDFSGTANTNCKLSGTNIYIDNFKTKGNQYIGANAESGVLEIHNSVYHDNGLSVQNIHATGSALSLFYGGELNATMLNGLTSVNANITCTVSNVANTALSNSRGYGIHCNSLTTNGRVFCGNSSSNFFNSTINTGGGNLNCGNSSSNVFAGAVNTGGGNLDCAYSSSNFFNSTVNTGGGNLNCGNSSSNYVTSTVDTGGGDFTTGICSASRFIGAINTGSGLFRTSESSKNIFDSTVTGNVGASFGTAPSSCSYFNGAVIGYSVNSGQHGVNFYNAATSAAVLRNQNSNTLMAN